MLAVLCAPTKLRLCCDSHEPVLLCHSRAVRHCCCAAILPQVEGASMRALQLSLPQLQQNFKKVEIPATLECSGNRRAEMKAIPAPGGSGHTIKGLDWDAGAIGTAVWGGVKLRDVLQAAGMLLYNCRRTVELCMQGGSSVLHACCRKESRALHACCRKKVELACMLRRKQSRHACCREKVGSCMLAAGRH